MTGLGPTRKTPGRGLAGVAHKTLDIENANRTVESVLPVLHENGLETAPLEMYLQWLESRRGKLPEALKGAGMPCEPEAY